ncbi:MAG: phosphoribosyltransferase family protein [Erythrobacter sp.]|uniref:phosphoribosyltransferase n=1 Tax=Erythrobacter sp. TaxID=1042 RepID=UPI0026391612|nr:phosphoribosyltransferase family protein [Erythrobacter sp.]MDJ0979409.1 phosphoribosyltransferase family protein [Erythrobacter sp.]
MPDKTYLDANELLELSFALANQIVDSGFVPTHIVGVWRGGAPIGIAVQELLEYRGISCDHIAIRTSSYTGIGQQARMVKVYALGYLIDTLNTEDRLLIVDDVFDTGKSVEAFINELKKRCRRNTPSTIRIATVFYKPSKNQTSLTPDYYIRSTEEWLVFPHEIDGLTEEEIRRHKPSADEILRRPAVKEQANEPD